MAVGSAEFGDLCSSVVVVVDSWLGEPVKFAGTCLFVELLNLSAGEAQEEPCLVLLATKSTSLTFLE